METKKTARFITDFYGSSPALGAEEIIKNWIDEKQTKWLASWAEQIAKKGENAINVLEQCLSVFHRDSEGNPILGNWMLRKCLINTGTAVFNAIKNKAHPKRDLIPMIVQLVEPFQISIRNGNGKILSTPDGVKTYTVTVKNRSFFKAYEYIKAGTIFEATIYFDDELLSEELIDFLLGKSGSVGVGAFRERFGKFVWI